VAEGSHHTRVLVVIEATSLHLLGESDEVGSVTQVPMLVSPERAGLAYTSLHLIDDEIRAACLGDVLEALSILGRELVIAALTHDRLNDDSANLATLSLPFRHLTANIS